MEAASRSLSASPGEPRPPAEATGVATLLRMLEQTHSYARAHGEAVSRLAGEIGRQLGLDGGDLNDLRLAGTLHDIGKLCVPAPIVEKEGPLSEAEWGLVRLHPAEGERLLRPFVRSSQVLGAVRWHHERWDGTGYPDGLEGAATPLTARIVSVADAYCAMVERRPYRPPLSVRATVAELDRHAGTQFDPRCVAALACSRAGANGRNQG